MARATEMALTGEAVDAATALEWGMVSSVVEPDELHAAARALADRVAANPPQALRMTKRLLREGQHQSLDALLELSAAMQTIAHSTADHHEAVAAMLDNEATVKTFKRTKGQVWLMPHNPAFDPIPGNDAAVLGKVVTVIRKI